MEELRAEVRRLRNLHNDTVVELSVIRAELRRLDLEPRHRDELLAARLEQLAEKCSVPPPALPPRAAAGVEPLFPLARRGGVAFLRRVPGRLRSGPPGRTPPNRSFTASVASA